MTMTDVESEKESSTNSLEKDLGIDGSTISARSSSEKSPKSESSDREDGSDKKSNENGLPESSTSDGDKSPSKRADDRSKTFDGDKETKVKRLRVVRSNSSPALCRQNNANRLETKSNTIGERGRLSDVSHVLFSTKNPPTKKQEQTAEHRDAKQKVSQIEMQETKSQPANRDDNIQSNNGDLAPLPLVPPTSQTNSRQNDDSQGTKKISPLPEKRDTEAIERINYQYQEKDPASNQKRNTLGIQPPSLVKSKETATKDLLSRFITYNDQLPPTPATPTRQYRELPQYTPKSEKRLSSLTKTRQREHSQASKQRKASMSNDGAQMCSIQSRHPVSPLQTPESQRQTGLLKSPKLKKEGSSSSQTSSSQSYPRSILPLLFDILRILVIMFSTASIIARSFVLFGGKFSPLYYISKSPILWAVRCYVAVFHVVLMIVELDIGVPFVIPKKMLDNFLQKGYIISFIGMLDLCMNSNKSLVDIVDELQGEGGELLSERGIRMRCTFAVLGISSRGLAACGLLYILLGFLGYNGESRRRLA